jgi:hypothetical protein
MSQSQTIINNHNGRWRSIFQKIIIMSKKIHNATCEILIDG